jgi:hypothetical protein
VDKEALVRAYDAMQSKDGMLRDVSSALVITSQERLYLIQVRKCSNGLPGSRGCCDTRRVPNEALRRPGARTSDKKCTSQVQNSLVPPKNAPLPESWHEQACLHLGLTGSVRLVCSFPSFSTTAFRTCSLSRRTLISADYLWQHSGVPRGAVPNHMLSSICIEHRPIFRRALPSGSPTPCFPSSASLDSYWK